MAYGQHQSFYIRERWISKALRNIMNDNTFFYRKDAFEKIGLGKNMTQALKYWVDATKISHPLPKEKKNTITELGKFIYKNDLPLEKRESKILLHYSIVSEIDKATTWYWFFNIYKKKNFTKEELFEDLKDYVESYENKKISSNSLKRDVDCLLKFYTADKDLDDPENLLFSPFASLGLIREHNNYYTKVKPNIERLNSIIFLYNIVMYGEKYNKWNFTLDELTYSEELLGKTLNLDKRSIITILSKLVDSSNYSIKFTRTNNIDTILIPEISTIKILKDLAEKQVI